MKQQQFEAHRRSSSTLNNDRNAQSPSAPSNPSGLFHDVSNVYARFISHGPNKMGGSIKFTVPLKTQRECDDTTLLKKSQITERCNSKYEDQRPYEPKILNYSMQHAIRKHPQSPVDNYPISENSSKAVYLAQATARARTASTNANMKSGCHYGSGDVTETTSIYYNKKNAATTIEKAKPFHLSRSNSKR